MYTISGLFGGAIDSETSNGFICLVCQHVCVAPSVYLNLGLNSSSYEESGDLVYKAMGTSVGTTQE